MIPVLHSGGVPAPTEDVHRRDLPQGVFPVWREFGFRPYPR